MAFPTLEDFKTPWEEKGEDLDPEKVKSFVYSKAKRAHDFEEEAKAAKKEIKERDDKIAAFEKAEADRARENETAEQKAQREAQARAEKETKQAEELAAERRTNALLKVQIETGLTERQVKRLQGDDFDALLKDAEEYMEENGIVKPGEEDPNAEEDPEDESNPLFRQPVVSKINPGDPKPNTGKEKTSEQVADAIWNERHSILV